MQYHKLVDENKNIDHFTENPFRLTMLLYLLEIEYDNVWEDYSVYSLYEKFYEYWRLREQNRKTSKAYKGKDTFNKHYGIARKLYLGETVNIKDEVEDTAVTGLLIIEESSEGKKVISFYHRSLNEFIIAKKCLEQLTLGGTGLVDVLLDLMKNDITDFIKDAFNIFFIDKLCKVQRNLEEVYKLIYKPDGSRMSSKIQKLDKKKLLILKDQIVFLVSRIPRIHVEEFLRLVNEKESDPIMQLNVAYATALKGPVLEIALEYAKKIRPNSLEDIINRSWTLVYYGDVNDDAYIFRDNGYIPWSYVRKARIRRLQEDKEKSIRFRMFDLPLLYTFFVSRNWRDLCEEELHIIKNCKTYDSGLPREVNKFMEKSKQKLCIEYEKQLSYIKKKN